MMNRMEKKLAEEELKVKGEEHKVHVLTTKCS
jgi:hypothetical protein